MKPRLRAEEEGRMEVPGLGEKEGLEILASCSGRPSMRNSVLDGFRVSRLESIHSEMDLRISCRREIAC